MRGHNRLRLDDEQRRTPMAPEAVERDPEETSVRRPRFDGAERGSRVGFKARTKGRTQGDEKCEQGSGHRRREFGEQYNSFPLTFRIFERHSQ
jgi:hypothetical protein